jgi:hypothetical protein
MSNRNYRIMLDKYKAMTPEQEETELRLRLERRARIARYRENYEAANPDDPFVQAKQQKINDRKDKARLLEAKRTPGTPEFEAHVEQELDTRIAREDVTVAWAKKNKKLPQARAILKQNRMKTGTGRALERAKTFMKTAAVGTVISGILGSVIAAVKFLSHVPDILTNVRTIAVKGATLGVTNAQLVRFAALEKRLPGLKEDDISGYLGNLHETLADVAAGGDPEGMLRKLGPLLAIGGDKKLAGKIVAYSTGGYMDTNELGMELLNAVLTTSMQGKTLYGSGYEPSDALRYNAVAFGRATGKPELAYSLNAAYADRNLIPADVAQQIRGVADGKAQVINGQEVAAGRTLLAFLAAIEGRKDTLKTTDTATIVEWKAAEDIAAQWRNLTAAFTEVRTGVLVAIGSTLSGILSFVEGIAKAVLTNPIFKHRFDDMVQGLDERSYYRNVERVKVLDSVTTLSKGLALKGGKSFGDETEEAVAETARKFFSGEGIPAEHVGRKEEFARYMLAIASWYEAENKLNEGKAMVEGYQNMGAEVEYVVRDELGQEKTKSYTYEVGNMNELSDATIPFNMVRARNNVMEGFARYIDFAEKINSKNILDMASLGLDRLVISWLEYVRSLGVEPTPVDPEGFAMFSAVGRYKNAAALSENLKTDGMQMGKPRPAGQEDRYVKGEAGVIISNAVRNEQTKLAQGHTVMHEIRAQVGENVFHGVLENKVEVSGLIKAENKTITVVLTDKATGKELGRAVDVPNIPTADVNLNVEAYMNSFQPAQ